ncbi:DNA mismatch repair endonuclease MutL [Blautia sp. NSJ-34]|uniref:DNA mismatch repair protein MutL n=1 Tax=Blautia celeris TaxID=2763026 RepID=A0ABR7FJS2_9FIRM|nr:DNA mismatch repair endonuclease MutL [Blautia celeris]
MRKIAVLDQNTIDKIAAGEVVERPASVVKELVENAIDAGSSAITVEIKEGGISFIRVTDNGGGMVREQVPLAFLRHATSKIEKVEDLMRISSLGFRGEALSSIAAVGQVELITKTPEALTGVRYLIEGGKEKSLEEIGAPCGTTIIVRNLFFNTPVRAKFLKTAMTEAGYVSSYMEQLALSHQDISFKFMVNGQTKLHSSGNASLKDVIYGIYGRDIAREVTAVKYEKNGISIEGFAGKPVIARGNRTFENYYINGRYVKSKVLMKAIEDAYKPYMMQHKYPFVCLQYNIQGDEVDVNVHPTKMEVRFQNQQAVYQATYEALTSVLAHRELIPDIDLDQGKDKEEQKRGGRKPNGPEPFEQRRRAGISNTPQKQKSHIYTPQQNTGFIAEEKRPYKYGTGPETSKSGSEQGTEGVVPAPLPAGVRPAVVPSSPDADIRPSVNTPPSGIGVRPATTFPAPEHGAQDISNMDAEEPSSIAIKSANGTKASIAVQPANEAMPSNDAQSANETSPSNAAQPASETSPSNAAQSANETSPSNTAQPADEIQPLPQTAAADPAATAVQESVSVIPESPRQMELFDDRLLSKKARLRHRIIGQLFDTYWLVEYDEKFYIIDQHAAHEKVLYERFMKEFNQREILSQMVSPPEIIALSLQEAELLKEQMEIFEQFGFEISSFGGREYSISAVPANLYGVTVQELFIEILDSLETEGRRQTPELITHRIATAACKAAVKGNQMLSVPEADKLIDELLGLENPYHCPHGRPTIVSMTKYELEKKFKRIV